MNLQRWNWQTFEHASTGLRIARTAASAGFTLIELLVVIAIIGMLASVVLASVDSARKKGAQAAAYAQAREALTNIESCMLNNSSNVLFCYGGTGFAGSWTSNAACGAGGGAYPVPGQPACGISGGAADPQSPTWPDMTPFGYSYVAYSGTYLSQSFNYEIYHTGDTGNVTAFCCTGTGCQQVTDSLVGGAYGCACEKLAAGGPTGNCP